MKKDKNVQESKDDALNLNDIRIIEKWLDTNNIRLNKFVFVTLTYGGFRASELVHMQKDWLHIDDEYSKKLELDYVQIPKKGQYCDCRDCKLQHFLEVEKVKIGVKYTKEWYTAIRKTFDATGAEGRYWEPKTNSGERKIPIVYNTFRDELLKFYEKNEKLEYSRQWVWNAVNNISKSIWGFKDVFKAETNKHECILNKPLYPHALRATAASLWAFKGMNATALKSIMGWSSIEIADVYVKSDETQAMHMAKDISNKEKVESVMLQSTINKI